MFWGTISEKILNPSRSSPENGKKWKIKDYIVDCIACLNVSHNILGSNTPFDMHTLNFENHLNFVVAKSLVKRQ